MPSQQAVNRAERNERMRRHAAAGRSAKWIAATFSVSLRTVYAQLGDLPRGQGWGSSGSLVYDPAAAGKSPFQRVLPAEPRSRTVPGRFSSFKEACMPESAWGGIGRPSNAEVRVRTARFLALVAAGRPYVEAARDARVSPWRALKLVSDPGFCEVVRALREGAAA